MEVLFPVLLVRIPHVRHEPHSLRYLRTDVAECLITRSFLLLKELKAVLAISSLFI